MKFKKIGIGILCCIFMMVGCSDGDVKDDYGVFLSSEYSSLPQDASYDVLVIDAQYYTEEEIEKLHEKNDKIYSYINVGAIENFRDYYKDYLDLTLGDYKNWPEERYVDVSDERWQKFIGKTLAGEIESKGIDGFFVDNADVYYEFKSKARFQGLTKILSGLKSTGLDVIINGGDVYVQEYLKSHKRLDNIADGINQECVYTSINWEEDTLEASKASDRKYYLEYLEKVKAASGQIYLLEYTKDSKFAKKIADRCKKEGYILYVSDSVELD